MGSRGAKGDGHDFLSAAQNARLYWFARHTHRAIKRGTLAGYVHHEPRESQPPRTDCIILRSWQAPGVGHADRTLSGASGRAHPSARARLLSTTLVPKSPLEDFYRAQESAYHSRATSILPDSVERLLIELNGPPRRWPSSGGTSTPLNLDYYDSRPDPNGYYQGKFGRRKSRERTRGRIATAAHPAQSGPVAMELA